MKRQEDAKVKISKACSSLKLGIDIDHVAKLASLELTFQETKKFSKQLPKILEYVEQLSQVDTKDVKPLAHAAGLKNVWREDKAIPSLTSQEALSNTKEAHNDLFKVKAIFDAEP